MATMFIDHVRGNGEAIASALQLATDGPVENDPPREEDVLRYAPLVRAALSAWPEARKGGLEGKGVGRQRPGQHEVRGPGRGDVCGGEGRGCRSGGGGRGGAKGQVATALAAANCYLAAPASVTSGVACYCPSSFVYTYHPYDSWQFPVVLLRFALALFIMF